MPQDTRITTTKMFIVAALAVLILVSGCQGPFDLATELGIDSGLLAVNPNNVTVGTSSIQDFTVTGGTGPFTWSVYSGPGSFPAPTNTATETFNSGVVAGITTIYVRDESTGFYGEAMITITDSAVSLSLLAGTNNLTVNDQLQLFAVGGSGSYSFSIFDNQSSGWWVNGSGLFSAGPNPGIDTIRVTDTTTLDTIDVVITVNPVVFTMPSIDYTVSNVTINTSPVQLNDVVDASFTYENTLADDGSADTIRWNAYVSTTNDMTGVIERIDFGDVPGINGIGSSGAIPIGGNWPSEPEIVNLYIVVHLSAEVDVDVNNNFGGSTAPGENFDIDYQAIDISVPSPPTTVLAGDTIDVEFSMNNSGSIQGVSGGTWTAYLSDNAVLDAGDDYLGTSTFGNISPGGPDETISISGVWPNVDANHHVFLRWTSPEQPGIAGTVSSGPWNVDPLDIEYQIQQEPAAGSSHFVGDSVTDSFVIRNNGIHDGFSAVFWQAWLSKDTSGGDPGDVLIDSGIYAGGIGGSTDGPMESITGQWDVGPDTDPDDFWIVVTWDAADDINPGNNSSFSPVAHTLRFPDVDYIPGAVSMGIGDVIVGSAISPVSETFQIFNNGLQDGTLDISWTAYASLGNATLDAGDIQLESGIIVGGIPNQTSTIPIGIGSAGATWPETPGNWNLLVTWEANDDEDQSDNLVDLGSRTVRYPDVDYIVSNLEVETLGPYVGGEAFSYKVTFLNVESETGLAADQWDWEVYLSTNNGITIDTGDVLIGSGVNLVPLAPGPPGFIEITGLNSTWPIDEDVYYLKGRVTAANETDAGNNISNSDSFIPGGYDVNNTTDFAVESFPLNPATMGYGKEIPASSFQYRNLSANTNTETLYWKVYASADQSLDTATADPYRDTLVFEGSIITPPAGGGSDTVNFGGGGQLNTYPYVGVMYLIATITSASDNIPDNNTLVSGQINVLEGANAVGDYDYGSNSYSKPIDDRGGTVAFLDADPANVMEIHRVDLWETVVITGTVDENAADVDTFHFDTGPGVTEITARLQWSNNNDYDFYIWNFDESSFYALDDVGGLEEPLGGGTWVVAMDPSSSGSICVHFLDDTPDRTGETYVLYLTGSTP